MGTRRKKNLRTYDDDQPTRTTTTRATTTRATNSKRLSARRAISSTKPEAFTVGSVSKINTKKHRRAATTRAMADEDEFEMPDFVKDLMKPPDASVAAPVWLAPLLGIVEESGDSAVA